MFINGRKAPVQVLDSIFAVQKTQEELRNDLLAKDIFPYTVIPKIPGFKIGEVKFPDQEIIAIKCIANDRLRLYNRYLSYFLQKINNVLVSDGEEYRAFGWIEPDFSYVIVFKKLIEENDQTVFDSAKDSMLILMNQYKNNVFQSQDFENISQASLDPAIKSIFKAEFGEWLIFVPSVKQLMKLDDTTFLSLFDMHDAEISDITTMLSYTISFVNSDGTAISHCTPVDLSGKEFSVNTGLDCIFSISCDEGYDIENLTPNVEGAIITENNGVYTLHRVASNIIITAALSFGAYSFGFRAVNCVLSGYPKRINPDTSYTIAVGVLGQGYEFSSIEATGCSAVFSEDKRSIVLSNATENSFILVEAFEYANISLPSEENFTISAVSGYSLHSKLFEEFKFTVVPLTGFVVSHVFIREIVSSPSEFTREILPDSSGIYMFIVTSQTQITVETAALEV